MRKDGSEVRYLQLAHNVWDPAAKRSRVQVIYNFGREEPSTREIREALAKRVFDRAAEVLGLESASPRTSGLSSATTQRAPSGTPRSAPG